MGTVDTDAGALDPRDGGTRRRVAMLEQLARIGMTIALTLQEQATIELARDMQVQSDWTPETGPTRVAPSEIPAALDIVSRSVRRTLALAEKLEAGRKARAARARTDEADAEDAENEDAAPGPDPVDPTIGPRARISRDVVRRALERAISAEAAEDQSENLLTDLYERLEVLGDDAEVAGLGLYDMLIRVCRGLGLTPDPARRIELRWGPVEDDPPHAPDWGPAVINAAIADLERQKLEIRAAMGMGPRNGPGPVEPAPRRSRSP
jgi:uncharacterized membrane protein YcjF (UPF0283 family)